MHPFFEKQNREGFTLVETLVAVTILILVVIGPITIAQKSIQNIRYANEQLTATFLAEEAMEAVRKLRDDRALEVWDTGTGETNDWVPEDCDDIECIYNPVSGSLEDDCTEECPLSFNEQTGVYGYEETNIDDTHHVSASPFERKIMINPERRGGRVVEVTVTWNTTALSGEKTVTLKTIIYDQYKDFGP